MQRGRVDEKKKMQIEAMSAEEVINELKQKRLATFGTAQERKERLKKSYGKFEVSGLISNASGLSSTPVGASSGAASGYSTHQVGEMPGNTPTQMTAVQYKKSSCLDEIERIQIQRNERRKRMEQQKQARNERAANNEAMGINVDVDF